MNNYRVYYFNKDRTGKTKNWVLLIRLPFLKKKLRICWHDKTGWSTDFGIKINNGRLYLGII